LIGQQGVASNNGAVCIFWWPDIIDNARLVLKVALAKQLQSLRTSRAALAAAHEAAQHSWAAASIFSQRKGHLPWQYQFFFGRPKFLRHLGHYPMKIDYVHLI
jgi:hypothetical protein